MNKLHSLKIYSFKQEIQCLGVYTKEISILKLSHVTQYLTVEKGMATHSSIPAWRIPWAEELSGFSPWGHKESDMTERLT